MTEGKSVRTINAVLQDELDIFPVWMSPEAKLLAILLAFVNPAIYDGRSTYACHVAQTSRQFCSWASWNDTFAVSKWSGVTQRLVGDIYDEMSLAQYSLDYRASIERSAEILRVDLPGVLALFDGCDNYTLSKPAGA